VDEEDAVDLHHHVALADPAAIVAVGPERDLHLDGARRVVLQELLAELPGVERLFGGARPPLVLLDQELEGALAQVRAVRRLEGVILGGADVPAIVDEPHDLVIAEERVHPAAGACGFALERSH
jgi:hypothetical protein